MRITDPTVLERRIQSVDKRHSRVTQPNELRREHRNAAALII
jgi:hypothetical protein